MAEVDSYCECHSLSFPIKEWYLEKAINVKPGYEINGWELEEGDLILRYLNNPSFIFPKDKPESNIQIYECLCDADFHDVVRLAFDINKENQPQVKESLDLSNYVINFLYDVLYINNSIDL